MHIDLGHREVSQDLPEPLETAGPWSFGTRALPATSLSIASLVALVIVSVVLLHDARQRFLFELPFEAMLLAWPSALLALFILWRASPRPGRHLPRYWALILTVLTFVLAYLVSIPQELIPTPVLHALVVAGFAAVLTLLPRLVKLRPHSPWVQRIALMSLLGVLLLVLPSACTVGTAVERHREEQVGATVRELRERAAQIREITRDFDWRKFDVSPDLAEAQLMRLGELSFADLTRDPRPYQAAAIFGREEELANAARELTDAVAESFDQERLPRVSRLPEPAIRWDTIEREWIESAAFPRLSAIVGRYHSELGRLLRELDPGEAALASDALQQLAEYHREKQAVVRDSLESELGSFADHWAVFEVPEFAEILGRDRPPLVEVLKMPLLRDGQHYLTAASLTPLLGLSLTRARTYSQSSPGCHPRNYPDDGSLYFRIDCYAYGSAPQGSGADMRMEFRLLYNLSSARPYEEPKPVEGYFIFPLPPGSDVAVFRDGVMNALASAAMEISPGQITGVDRSGSVVAGFRYVGSGSSVRVHPLSLDITGYVKGRQAIQVRIIPLRTT